MQPIAQKAMAPDIIKKVDDAGVIAVLVIDEVKHAMPVAKALLAGGVSAIELTLRTPVAWEAANAIKDELPEITLGFGTVLTVEQVQNAAKVGADFAVAPGCNPKVIAAAQDYGLSFAPGIVTPSDIEMALEQGCRILKYFPAETSGGMKHLTNMVAPYNYLNLKFIPLGGLSINNAAEYLKSPLITAIGGSWIAKQDLIRGEQWAAITQNAHEISQLIKDIRRF
ncbi:bifunctional 4-hydroxy-2-oxoglutarate aldolase/2-dehydro-3-deoxy-phosphogluconate aldolase [Carboxylicivirga mesophila]|uniref:2-dehydro-3-deoxy-phosphogluconate aldolase n=1 Tax=Carboxylicivirga mesophila TaxID=1166478 RepID=A0ABS5K8E7_9BACT|nr:bifunctional 4-hydroxy-2-oxoglutarate aldolase/2-dehydro-3-deoxy-phosphogluconate aldolase [Carboxylicivirga mesophila]MBS2211275.1 bifunctional 4-hydroxy-2-oxoglutarate aldolase/2-dehydro-3-deoxy-phosphogluconate aldolase [Carboxylicivirga mesophila]